MSEATKSEINKFNTKKFDIVKRSVNGERDSPVCKEVKLQFNEFVREKV